MRKFEKEVKILDIDKEEIKKILKEKGANYLESSLQQIYVYDLPSIRSRFYDCILQLKKCTRPYDYEICKSRLKQLFIELDNLITPQEQEVLRNTTKYEYLGDILKDKSKEELLKLLENEKIIDIINNYEINPNKWVRLRRTNNKTTITVKHILNPKTQEMQKMSIQSVLETEMEVPSMEIGNSLLEQLGFSFRNYQEKERETYVLDGVEIDIDTWPMIPTYIEIENDSESKIKEIIEKLGLENNEIVSCNTEDVYKKYGIDLYQFRELRFEKK